jgi:protein-disulfide isomerase
LLGRVLAEFPDKIRLVFKDFPLSFHAGAEPAAMAARCAAEHGRYWEYHDLLFVAQPAFARSDLLLYARRLGLPQEAFAACLDIGRYRAAVRKDLQEGRAAGVTGTPTFFVNDRRLVGIQPIDVFRDAVQDALDDAARAKRP